MYVAKRFVVRLPIARKHRETEHEKEVYSRFEWKGCGMLPWILILNSQDYYGYYRKGNTS